VYVEREYASACFLFSFSSSILLQKKKRKIIKTNMQAASQPFHVLNSRPRCAFTNGTVIPFPVLVGHAHPHPHRLKIAPHGVYGNSTDRSSGAHIYKRKLAAAKTAAVEQRNPAAVGHPTMINHDIWRAQHRMRSGGCRVPRKMTSANTVPTGVFYH
jgi:hypothetical protein